MQSSIVRRLGPKFLDLIDHVREMELPPAGLPLAVFGLSLTGVPPHHADEVAHALARKGVVWIGNDAGVATVFKTKPDGLSWRREADPLDDVTARIAVPARAMAKFLHVEAEATSTTDKVAARAAIEAAARRALKEVAEGLARGLPLGALRSEIHAVFHSAVVDAIARIDPALDRNSEAKELSTRKALARRGDIATKPASFRVGLEIGRRGLDGASRSDLLQGLHPRIKADALTKALAALEARGMVASVRMLAPNQYRKAPRYFMAGSVPALDAHGRPLKAP